MNWFTKFCRNAGLMVHHIVHPDDTRTQRREVSRTVDERKVNDRMILRRTTIDEIEIKRRDNENDTPQ
ncbi:MAG: hypothetical protein ACODAQ_10770 [Phycisphaeraceae bacterium]